MSGKNKTKIMVSLIFSLSLVSVFLTKTSQQNLVHTAYAQETQADVQTTTNINKDTDLDGLSDVAELSVYKTKIDKEDSDNDGVLDAQEIVDGTDPTDAGSSVLRTYKMLANSPLQEDAPIMWYIGRITGIAAFIIFTLVICMGLMMTSKVLLKFPLLSAPNALETHSFNATFIALSLVVAHFVSFMFDSFIKLSLPEIFIPFLVQRDLKSAVGWELGLPISIGIIAFYLALLLVLTSQFRRKIVPLKLWRAIHYTSFLFYLTFLAHGYYAGTDSTEGWMIAIYISSIVLVVGLLLLRIFGKKYFMPTVKPITPVQPTPQMPTQTEEPAAKTPTDGESQLFNGVEKIQAIHG